MGVFEMQDKLNEVGHNVKFTLTGIFAAAAGMLNSFTISLFNVPLNVIILAAAGCLLSYAYNENREKVSRKKFYFSVLANTFTACAAVSVAPHLLGWSWYSDKMMGSVAFLFALSARFAVPFFFKMVPEIIRRWFRIGEYKDTSERVNYESSTEYERLPDDFK